MGRIPIITNDVSAKIGRSEGNAINAFANPNTFGAAKGAALQDLARSLGAAATDIEAYANNKRDEKVANAVAQTDFTPRELEIKSEIGPDGAGLHDKTLQAFDEYVNEQANLIDDNLARQKYKLRMAEERQNVSRRSITEQFTLDTAYSKQQAEASLFALENKILSDPTGYDSYIRDGLAVLDTRQNVPAYLRESMKLAWKQNSAKARFTGMLEKATTVEDIDRISAELVAKPKTGKEADDFVGRDWTKEMLPGDYEKLVNDMGVARKAIVTKADADAKAAIDTLSDRSANVGALIPKDELSAVAQVVKTSQNPITQAKFARIVRDEEIKASARKLPVAEQRAQINGAKGNPNTAYPGVPARVSNAANKAAEKFGVSASYLAMTAQREYGQYFKRTGVKANTQFAPVAQHGGVDLRNVRADVVDAATVAGELFGAPLNITSGYRSQAKQDNIRRRGNPNRASVAKHSHHTNSTALDISTTTADGPMSGADRAKLVGALVDAGFTGIGEYGTHIHADFREAVPSSFGDRDGKTWGGWTYLSPEVADALKARGFAAGTAASGVQRAAAVKMEEDVDYSQSSDMGGTATGVMQFNKDTFLRIVKNPEYAAKIGVDVTGMSDDQILELRKDPDISIMAAGALSQYNKKSVEGALGREIDDAELYMAHFLGDGGAIALLKGRQLQPEQSAAKLLPKAAAANKPVFYHEDGRERTVGELYNELARTFVASQTRVSFDDVQTRQKVLENTEKQLQEDPVGYAREVGTQSIPDFSVDNLKEYGEAVRSVAEFYQIPMSDMKVLGPSESEALKKALDEAPADQALDILASVQEMGGDVARAALKQLGEKDNVYAYAGALAGQAEEPVIAGDVLRGQKRINENPNIKREIGATDEDLTDAFRRVAGNTFNEVSPRVRQDIQDAALAHYVETTVARGKGNGFDPGKFGESVVAVTGGRMAEVNGEPTVLPKGVTGEQMETALQRMGVADWADMSRDGLPPRYVDGTVADPEDLADEAKLRPIGVDEYKVQLDDGTFLVTGEQTGSGRLKAFVFRPDPERIAKLQAEPGAEVDSGELPNRFYNPQGTPPSGSPFNQFYNPTGKQ